MAVLRGWGRALPFSRVLVVEAAAFGGLRASFFCWRLSCGCADRVSRQLVRCGRLVPLAFLGLVVPPPAAGRVFHQNWAVNGAAGVVTGVGGGDLVVTVGLVMAATDASGVRPQRPERIALQASAARADRSAGLSGPSGSLCRPQRPERTAPNSILRRAPPPRPLDGRPSYGGGLRERPPRGTPTRWRPGWGVASGDGRAPPPHVLVYAGGRGDLARRRCRSHSLNECGRRPLTSALVRAAAATRVSRGEAFARAAVALLESGEARRLKRSPSSCEVCRGGLYSAQHRGRPG
jgi:hypothetical protein